eukprot:g11955.t1
MPLCISRDHKATCGVWAREKLWLEFTYWPLFRLFEGKRCPEIECLLEIKVKNDMIKSEALPSNSFLVVSYSMSSDLSHSDLPKAECLTEAVASSALDPSALQWEVRLPKIKRQLLCHTADIICVQNLQSIGFHERCSETNLRWFSCDDEPSVNHLVYLYRELARKNYGVAFAPSLRLPGAGVICFGHAVFWKRNRWQLERQWAVGNTAICVELSSKLESPNLLVCCSRGEAVYAEEWGHKQPLEAFMAELKPVETELLEHSGPKLRPLWCGDFGPYAEAVVRHLGHDVKESIAFSAVQSVLEDQQEHRCNVDHEIVIHSPKFTSISCWS